MMLLNCSNRSFARHRYQATKTDIKKIKAWLRRSKAQQQCYCPFGRRLFADPPHWKCWNIFGDKII
jgi:hypothetical protein